MIYLLILFPLVLAGVTFAMPSNRWRPLLLPVGALGHLGLVAAAVCQPNDGAVTLSDFGASTVGLLGEPSGQGPLLVASAVYPGRTGGGWLLLDPLGKVVLGFLSVL